MSVYASIFPEERFILHQDDAKHYPICLRFDNITIFLTETQADNLAELLWNRNVQDRTI